MRPPRDRRRGRRHRGQAARRSTRSTFTNLLPTWLGKLTLLCIAIGAVAANALNIYSGAMSFLALGIKLPPHIARAIVAVVFGLIGFVVALSGLHATRRRSTRTSC